VLVDVLVEKAARAISVRAVRGIERCHIVPADPKSGKVREGEPTLGREEGRRMWHTACLSRPLKGSSDCCVGGQWRRWVATLMSERAAMRASNECFTHDESAPPPLGPHLQPALVRTEGINFAAVIRDFSELVDLTRIESNSMHHMADTFGLWPQQQRCPAS